MSSHREALEISKDPTADNTDVYAFRTEGDTVTLIANYIPLQTPAGGPTFYQFDPEVLYEIHVDNTGDGNPNVTFQFRFRTEIRNPDTFLYNTGPIFGLFTQNWNLRQRYEVTRIDRIGDEVFTKRLATSLISPPVNIGPRSTPDYQQNLGDPAVYAIRSGIRVFAGQRADPFWVDLGSVFDLLALRPFQNLHAFARPEAPGVDTLADKNVHTIAVEVPISQLTRDGSVPTDPMDAKAVVGVWATASRQRAKIFRDVEDPVTVGPFQQVSRLGNPLVNEVLIPYSQKDEFNRSEPSGDEQYANFVLNPEPARLLPALYPGVFPNLANYNEERSDLAAILLTGIPQGVVEGFQNFTGPTQADLLRLNVAIPISDSPNRLGLIGGDPQGFPNGRRPLDDVTTIELRAVAGATIPLVDPDFTPDDAASAIEDGTYTPAPPRDFLPQFPYIGTPHAGFFEPDLDD